MPPVRRSLLPLFALLGCLLLGGCGDGNTADQPQSQSSPHARDAVSLEGNAEKALEVLEGYWLGQVRIVKGDDTQAKQFEFVQRVTDLGQVYQYLLDAAPATVENHPLVHEYDCLSFNSGAIEDPTHWVFLEKSVLVVDELPAEASLQAWENFQAGEEFEIAPDCWMRRKYLVHEVENDRLLLMQPRRMTGWIGTESYEELGIQGVVVELIRLTEKNYREILKMRHTPYYE